MLDRLTTGFARHRRIAREIDRAQLQRTISFQIATHCRGDQVPELLQHLFLGHQIVGHGDFRHRNLMLQSLFLDLIGGHHGEDRPAMLNCDAAPCREAPAITNAVNLVDNGRRCVAGQDEISVQGVRRAVRLDRAGRGDERLRDYKTAESTLAPRLGRAAPEEIQLKLFQVKDG